MTTATKLQEQEELLTALYCRLSVDDIKEDAEENESNSIKNQKTILEDYRNNIFSYICIQHISTEKRRIFEREN